MGPAPSPTAGSCWVPSWPLGGEAELAGLAVAGSHSDDGAERHEGLRAGERVSGLGVWRVGRLGAVHLQQPVCTRCSWPTMCWWKAWAVRPARRPPGGRGPSLVTRLRPGSLTPVERTRATIGSPSVWTHPSSVCGSRWTPGRDLGGVDPGVCAELRGALGCRGVVGKVLAEDSRCCCAVVDDDPPNLDRDREPLPVVDVHQATDGATMTRTQEVFPLRGDRLQPCPVRPLLHGRGSLHEHVERGSRCPRARVRGRPGRPRGCDGSDRASWADPGSLSP